MEGKEKILKICVRIGKIMLSFWDLQICKIDGIPIEKLIDEKLNDDNYLYQNQLYFSDGYIVLQEDGTFKGFLTNDTIDGFVIENNLNFIINIKKNLMIELVEKGTTLDGSRIEFTGEFYEPIDFSDEDDYILRGIDKRNVLHYARINFKEVDYKPEISEKIKKILEENRKGNPSSN